MSSLARRLTPDHQIRPPAFDQRLPAPDGCTIVPPIADDQSRGLKIHTNDLILELFPSPPPATTLRVAIERSHGVAMNADQTDGALVPFTIATDYQVVARIAKLEQSIRGEFALGANIVLSDDAETDRLVRALLTIRQLWSNAVDLSGDAVSQSIIDLITKRLDWILTSKAARSVSKLPRWRIKRVAEYIDAHIGGTIGLADLANAAGLTRMYFAAQFRAALGVRPRAYVLQRRIEIAQKLLLLPRSTLADVALTVGFKTQAHFTTTFKRLVGETPHRWKSRQGSGDRLAQGIV